MSALVYRLVPLLDLRQGFEVGVAVVRIVGQGMEL